MRKHTLKAALPILLISLGVSSHIAIAADEGSLDTMWNDPSVTKKAGGDEGQTTAALCSLESLNHSDLIKSGGWPGIGPFKADNGGFVDAGQNRLEIQSNNNKVTAAEFRLNNQPKQTALVNLEMTTDFLLESLGAKAARISDFNSQFEKAKLKVLQSSKADPLNLSAGSYIVNLHPDSDSAAADKYSFIIKVSGKDVSPGHQASAATESATPAVDSAPPKVASAAPDWNQSPQSTAVPTTPAKTPSDTAPAATTQTRPKQTSPTISTPSNLNFGIEKPKIPAKTTAAKTTTPAKTPDNNGWGDTKPATSEAATPAVTPNKTPTPDASSATPPEKEDLKTKFADILQNWQNVKKTAVRQKDIAELPEVLSGRALAKQSDAVKWLATNKKYYEMTPKGVVVDKVVDLGKGQKYSVYAEVKEYSKYIDEVSGQTLKTTDDTYNVIYTLEKNGERWFISDSTLANQPSKTAKPTTSTGKRR